MSTLVINHLSILEASNLILHIWPNNTLWNKLQVEQAPHLQVVLLLEDTQQITTTLNLRQASQPIVWDILRRRWSTFARVTSRFFVLDASLLIQVEGIWLRNVVLIFPESSLISPMSNTSTRRFWMMRITLSRNWKWLTRSSQTCITNSRTSLISPTSQWSRP